MVQWTSNMFGDISTSEKYPANHIFVVFTIFWLWVYTGNIFNLKKHRAEFMNWFHHFESNKKLFFYDLCGLLSLTYCKRENINFFNIDWVIAGMPLLNLKIILGFYDLIFQSFMVFYDNFLNIIWFFMNFLGWTLNKELKLSTVNIRKNCTGILLKPKTCFEHVMF
jgi:hypothetical protein